MRRFLPHILFLLLATALPAGAQGVEYQCNCEDDNQSPTQIPLMQLPPVFCATSQAECKTYCTELATGGSPTKPECDSAVVETPGGTSDPETGRTVTLKNPLNTASIPELVGNIIKAAVGVVGAFALLIFVYGGFLLLTSAGEAAKIQAGKDAMKWSVIGLVVVFSSYALVKFVLSTLTK